MVRPQAESFALDVRGLCHGPHARQLWRDQVVGSAGPDSKPFAWRPQQLNRGPLYEILTTRDEQFAFLSTGMSSV